jgi:hypothetical protein
MANPDRGHSRLSYGDFGWSLLFMFGGPEPVLICLRFQCSKFQQTWLFQVRHKSRLCRWNTKKPTGTSQD